MRMERITRTAHTSRLQRTSPFSRRSRVRRTSRGPRASRIQRTSRGSRASRIQRTSRTSRTSRIQRTSRGSRTSRYSLTSRFSSAPRSPRTSRLLSAPIRSALLAPATVAAVAPAGGLQGESVRQRLGGSLDIISQSSTNRLSPLHVRQTHLHHTSCHRSLRLAHTRRPP